MNTTPAARNISAARWVTPRGIAAFAGSRNYGIVDGAGRMLSTNGEAPSVWRSMAAAKTVAEYQAWPARSIWIEPVR